MFFPKPFLSSQEPAKKTKKFKQYKKRFDNTTMFMVEQRFGFSDSCL